MRTTLNIPDALMRDAKRRAIDEGTTVTQILVQGLRQRLTAKLPARALPVSSATGGLVPGVDWVRLESADAAGEGYR